MVKRPQSSTLVPKRRSRSRPQPFRELAAGKEPKSARVTLDLNPEAIAALDALKKRSGSTRTNTEVIREALRLHYEAESDRQTPAVPKAPTVRKGASSSILLRNRKKIINYSTVLIEALQEALDYNPSRHHNSRPPPLFVDDERYLSDIAELVGELRRLNDLLEKTTNANGKVKSANQVDTYLQLFMKNYTPALGKGAAYLTVGIIATLLTHMGLEGGAAHVLPHFK